jgi:FMN phosphatase YigB (HAD superfamily)
MKILGPVDWSRVDLVAFDVDGTLYDQRALRMRMMREMIGHAARERSLETMGLIRTYRRIRERLGEEEATDFEQILVSETALRVGCSKARVASVVAEWIERRPLRHLQVCRCPGLQELFAALRRSGKTIGILSDYPAREKLRALGLETDLIVCAGDAGVDRLKPHPQGLQVLIARAGATASETILIGDRIERDGLSARRAGAGCLIRSRKPQIGWTTFYRYDALLFAPLFAET